MSPVDARSSRPRLRYAQAVAYRLRVNQLSRRLPKGSYVRAAYAGLQDSAPRDALLGMHARVARCEPSAWEHPDLIQTYSLRGAVFVLPKEDFGVFTLGRLPLAPEAVAEIDQLAERACEALAGEERRGMRIPGLRYATASGRLAVRWTTSALWVRQVPKPDLDPAAARAELCRRHVHRFGPTTPRAFAWWSGLPSADARAVWNSLSDQLLEVDLDGTPAWVWEQDLQDMLDPEPQSGARFLVAPDLRLFGSDKQGLFVGPGRRPPTPASDTFHPNGILLDGRIVGAWGRRGGRVEAVLSSR